MGFSKQVATYHAPLAAAVKPLIGQSLRAGEVKTAFVEATGDVGGVKWVLASDHCSNRENDGACWCAGTPQALFQAQGDGEPYHYPYLVVEPEPGTEPDQH